MNGYFSSRQVTVARSEKAVPRTVWAGPLARLFNEVGYQVNEILVQLGPQPIATPPMFPLDTIGGGVYATV